MMKYDEIVDTKIYELVDGNEANVLFATRHNPELTIKLIANQNVEFTLDGNGESAFEDLSKKELKTYYDLGLHEYTKNLPKEYFTLFLRDDEPEEIEYISDYFKNRDSDLFIEHPDAIRYLTFDDFSDKEFFKKICNATSFEYYAGMYAIEVAIAYRYEDLIKKIKFGTGFVLDRSPDEWKLLSEDSILYLLKRETESSDPEEILNVAFTKNHQKIIDYVFETDDVFTEIKSITLKEKIIKTIISKKYNNLFKSGEFVLDIQISLSQNEYNYLVSNFPEIEVENPYDNESTTGLYYYGVYHKLDNLPKYELDWCYRTNILILHKLENDIGFLNYVETLFPNQELYNSFFDFDLFEGDRHQYYQRFLPLLKKFSPIIEERFGHMHEEHYSTY